VLTGCWLFVVGSCGGGTSVGPDGALIDAAGGDASAADGTTASQDGGGPLDGAPAEAAPADALVAEGQPATEAGGARDAGPDGPDQSRCGTPIEGMVCIPGAIFPIGGTVNANEMPIHDVTINAFQLDLHEVTVAEFAACVAVGACAIAGGPTTLCDSDDPTRGNYPVNCLSWDIARMYCSWKQKRLPTQEEWEYAARRPDGREYPWGNDPPDATRANLSVGQDGFPDLAPVGSFPGDRTYDGVLDMGGNVAEWTFSTGCPYTADACRNPCSTCASADWVVRGGAWTGGALDARAAARRIAHPADRVNNVGFRCAFSTGFL